MANAIEKRYGRKELHANGLRPGGIITGLQENFDKQTRKVMAGNEIVKSMKQRAATSVLVAVGREWRGVGGRYWRTVKRHCYWGRTGVGLNGSI